MKNCKECGHEIKNSAKFCPKCGTQQEVQNLNTVHVKTEHISEVPYESDIKTESETELFEHRKDEEGIDKLKEWGDTTSPSSIAVDNRELEQVQQMQMLFCGHCGNELNGATAFCPNCGANLHAKPTSSMLNQNASQKVGDTIQNIDTDKIKVQAAETVNKITTKTEGYLRYFIPQLKFPQFQETHTSLKDAGTTIVLFIVLWAMSIGLIVSKFVSSIVSIISNDSDSVGLLNSFVGLLKESYGGFLGNGLKSIIVREDFLQATNNLFMKVTALSAIVIVMYLVVVCLSLFVTLKYVNLVLIDFYSVLTRYASLLVPSTALVGLLTLFTLLPMGDTSLKIMILLFIVVWVLMMLIPIVIVSDGYRESRRKISLLYTLFLYIVIQLIFTSIAIFIARLFLGK